MISDNKKRKILKYWLNGGKHPLNGMNMSPSKIYAIAMCRHLTQMGLVQSKEVCDSMDLRFNSMGYIRFDDTSQKWVLTSQGKQFMSEGELPKNPWGTKVRYIWINQKYNTILNYKGSVSTMKEYVRFCLLNFKDSTVLINDCGVWYDLCIKFEDQDLEKKLKEI